MSFGMQSAVPHVLKNLDRTHTPANVEAGVRAADRAGLRSSVDLIYGAPGESLDDWRDSVRTAVDLGVNHVSAYALTVEPTTKMGRQIAAGTLPKPDDDDEAAKYEIADDLFAAAGLEWYEISNWSRPGYESRHNLGYWRNVDWAGLGPGAHSHYNTVMGSSTDGDAREQRRRWRRFGFRNLHIDARLGHRASAHVGDGHQRRACARGRAMRPYRPRRTLKSSSCLACAFGKGSTSASSIGISKR